MERLPVHPMTRFWLAFISLLPGGFVVAFIVGPLVGPGAALVVLVACAARGAVVRAVLTPDHIRIRNLWWTYDIPASAIDEITVVRGAGIMKATTPALSRHGKRLRLPIHAGALWGSFFSGARTMADRHRYDVLAAWAERNSIPVSSRLSEVVAD